MRVTFFHRKPHPFHFSIEAIFEGVRKHLPPAVEPRVAVCPYPSQGIVNRIKGTLWAKKQQSTVNHITGDVHFLALSLDSSRTVLTIHDCGFMDHPSPLARALLWLFWLKLPVSCSKVVTTISESSKEAIVQHTGCPPEKVRVVPDFIAGVFSSKPKPFNAECPKFLIIGTKPNKNIPRILEALQGISCELIVIGAPQEALREQIEATGIAYAWHSRIPMEQVFQCYVEADALLFPSLLEGFGMPIIEAQTVERVVITSNVSSMPEVAGEGALLVDPYDVASIREGVLRIIEDADLRSQLLEKGRLNRQRFDPVKIARQYTAIYEEITGVDIEK